MSSDNTTLYAGIVIALIIGAAVGYFVYPSMNPGLDPNDYVEKSTYNVLQSDYDDSQEALIGAKASLGGALSKAALSDIVLSQIKGLTTGKKIGLITGTGGLGDKSFNDISNAGAQRAKDELGVEFDIVQPTAIAEYEGYQRDFAMSGEYEVIICVGFDQGDALTIVAAEYPDQNFAIVDMVVDAPNVASLTFRANEGSFLLGVVAGLTTETGSIGFVGGIDIPLIRDFYVGYKAGAEWANPTVTVGEPVFVGGWGDPASGKELALGLIELGYDGIFAAAGGSGLGALEAAHEQGITGYGVDACQDYLHDEIIASMTKRVDNAVFQMILAATTGTFQGGFYSGGLAESWTGMCRLPEEEALWESTFGFVHDPIDEDILAKVMEAQAKIIAGDISVPSGFG